MPTNRTPLLRDAKQRITPKALAAYRRIGEDEDARAELFFALARKPWQFDVLHADDDTPPAYLKDSRIEDYLQAREVKRELDRLVGD